VEDPCNEREDFKKIHKRGIDLITVFVIITVRRFICMTSEFIVAVNCMVFLSRGGKATSEKMAAEACTNASRVRRVMSMLKKGGLMCTKEGAWGGYTLCRPPEEVSLGEVFSLTSGYAYVYRKKQPSIDFKCMEVSGMQAVMEKINLGMEETCRHYLDAITLLDVLQSLSADKKK